MLAFNPGLIKIILLIEENTTVYSTQERSIALTKITLEYKFITKQLNNHPKYRDFEAILFFFFFVEKIETTVLLGG